MPDKLTDGEIVKAFKCCADINDKCPECPLKDKNRESCVGILMSNALDIFNRQKEDLIDKEKQLQEALKRMAVNKTKVIDLEKEINRLQAENKNLQEKNSNLTSDLTSLQNDLTSLKAENERLKYFNSANVASAVGLQDKLETAKAEAYKEFAELLSERFRFYQGIELLFRKDLHNLLKELVGEDK